MAQSPGGVGPRQAGGLGALQQVLGQGPARAGAPQAAATVSLGRPSGPKGMRMLSPDTPVDQLDRSAPRGTYLDVLV